jgi:NAD(P)-dependent dehydrogenase (short-subunit alcohol dehydrogenase family)
VLVTGGVSGLGGAVVDMVVAAGGRAVMLDLNEAKGRAKTEQLGNTVRFVRGDVTQEADVQRAVDMATADFGQLDGVVNAAGIPAAERVLGREGVQPLDHFTRVIHVNLIGTFNVVRLAAAAMDRNTPNAAGERGVIVNTASVAAFDGQIGQAAYSASKGGIVGMTLPIAREFARIVRHIFENEMLNGEVIRLDGAIRMAPK